MKTDYTDEMQLERIRAEIVKLMAETSELNAEAAQMTRERYWYPAVVIATVIGTTLAFAKLFLS